MEKLTHSKIIVSVWLECFRLRHTNTDFWQIKRKTWTLDREGMDSVNAAIMPHISMECGTATLVYVFPLMQTMLNLNPVSHIANKINDPKFGRSETTSKWGATAINLPMIGRCSPHILPINNSLLNLQIWRVALKRQRGRNGNTLA